MTAVTIDEALRRVMAVGGDPRQTGGLDNFCWPSIQYHPEKNPDGKYKAAQLVRSNLALRDICLAFEIPLLSGKDSMYIDGDLKGPYGETRKVSGLPTLLFTATSVVEDVRNCITMDAKMQGDLIYVLGETRDELGGGEFYQMMGEIGLNVPRLDPASLTALYARFHHAVELRLLASAHAVTRGGLAVHLAMVAMGGELGMEINVQAVPGSDKITPTRILYSESAGRFICTVAPANQDAFETLFHGLPVSRIGRVTDSGRFVVRGGANETLLDEAVQELKTRWMEPFGGLV